MAKTYPNTVLAKGTNTNDATDTFNITAANAIVNLSLIKPAPPVVVVGVDFNYTVVVKNNDATETAFSVVFTDNAPDGIAFKSASSTAGTVTINGSGNVTGSLGDILPGESVTVTIVANVTP